MNLKLEKDEIRKKYFSSTWGAAIIISVLGVGAVLMVCFSGIFNVKNMNQLYDCIAKNGIIIIVGIFFFAISLCYWIKFFLNIVVKPKKEVLYLYKNEEDEIYFINKKGKRYNCDFNEDSIEGNNYYYALKTHDYVYEIIEKTNDNWIPKEKKRYWLNFYTPIGKFENICLLPVIYIILLYGLLSLFMSKGYQRICGVIFSIIPLYIIIYDLIYKNKLKQADNKEIDERNFLKSYEILQNSISIIITGIVAAILLDMFFKSSNNTTKLIFSPFVVCGLYAFGGMVAKAFKKDRLEKIYYKGYIIIFLIYWFGFLSFWTIGIVKQEGNYLNLVFSIPFWIIGVFILYKEIIKK